MSKLPCCSFVVGLLSGGLVTLIIFIVMVKIHLGNATNCIKEYDNMICTS